MSLQRAPQGRPPVQPCDELADELEVLYSSLKHVGRDLGEIYEEVTGKQSRSFSRVSSMARNERRLSNTEAARFREVLDIAYRDKRLKGPTYGNARTLEVKGINPAIPGYVSEATGVNPEAPPSVESDTSVVHVPDEPEQLLELIREMKAELCRREAEAAGSWQQRFDAGELWVDWDADFMLLLRDGVPRPASHNEFHCISCGDHVQLRFGASAGMVAARLYLCQPCDEHVVPPPIREWNLWVSTRGRLGTGYGVEALREWWQQVLDATDDGEVAE